MGREGEMHVVEESGTDVGAALVLWRRRWPYREVVVPPVTPYSAILLREDDEAAVHARRSVFEALLASLEARFHRVCLHLPPALTDVRPAQWRGWSARPFYTYRLHLGPADMLLEGWSSTARRTYRKGGEHFRLDEGPGGAAAVARFCTNSYDRHERSAPLPAERMAYLIARMHTEGLARVFTVTAAGDDGPSGGLAVLHDGRTAAYWIAGSVPGPAMTVLLGKTLPRLHADGIEWFDFVGANTPSIAEFKRKFGPALAPYFRVETCTRPELALLLRLRR